MRRLALLLALAGPASRAQAEASLDSWGVLGLAGGYYGSRTEVASPVGKGYYSVSARVNTFRYYTVIPGTREEYSASLRRELYHVSVAGRLGTSPPNMQRAEYHLAQGEALLTFYGLTLGPEHPELSTVVWESSGPAPVPESFDRTWVTALRTIYTNTNVHMEHPVLGASFQNSPPAITENAWQFELRETWRGRTSLSLQMGFARYNQLLRNFVETVFLDNLQYPGNPFAISGWPNNYAAAEVWQRLGDNWKASFGATRLNLLNNGLFIAYGTELECQLGSRFRLRSGYYHARRRFVATREGVTLGLTYLW